MAVKLKRGDITLMHVDAIVNAANTRLEGGGGVDGAIHRAGGPAIMQACRKIGHCPVGESVITTGGQLPCRYVIHTVGPVWHGGFRGEAQKLANCYLNSMKLAVAHKLQTIAFPNISTGVYGYPKEEAAQIAIDTVKKVLKDHDLIMVFFICFDEDNYSIYHKILSL